MDELQMVKDRYPEPAPPTARAVARARALVDDPPRRPLPRLWIGLAGLASAGTAAAVAVAATGSGGVPEKSAPLTLDGRAAVLAAADRAAAQPSGNYWHVDQVEAQSYIVRAPSGAYAITAAAGETFSLRGARRGMGETYHERTLPARPASAQDAALWRKAGSPKTFRVWSGDHYGTYTTKATPWRAKSPDAQGGGGFLDGGATADDLRRLPTDPAALAARFFGADAAERARLQRAAGMPSSGDAAAPGVFALARASGLLAQQPLPPKVRAGLIRAVAAQPGVHAIGRVTDPLGRRGIALATADRPVEVTGEFGTPAADRGAYRSRKVLVLDERTGALLADEEELTVAGGPYAGRRPGFVIDYVLIRSSGWSEGRTRAPAALPFG
ncbi:hypothetical protein [Actinomadura parmotrematis]|uniref:CU044_5270 family protein n=1 Tax=Actinomadura parmotrematis TaxID=2864039 RepID=A0ABS7FZC5_9ACTN|nr:hypothetical protein [Actinomadura parmotrematis]MBW8485803.1 hypothetical protein [Actinomadura parmotrematis]